MRGDDAWWGPACRTRTRTRVPRGRLQAEFGPHLGEQLHAMARGAEPRGLSFDVRAMITEKPKSLQNEMNWNIRFAHMHWTIWLGCR